MYQEEEAKKLLLGIRPYIRYFNSSQYIHDLANGDIFQAAKQAKESRNGITINYIISKEGSMLEADMMAIPKDAKNPTNAYRFMDYLRTLELDTHRRTDVGVGHPPSLGCPEAHFSHLQPVVVFREYIFCVNKLRTSEGCAEGCAGHPPQFRSLGWVSRKNPERIFQKESFSLTIIKKKSPATHQKMMAATGRVLLA